MTNDAMPPLSFVGGGESPVQYDADYLGQHYYVRYRFGVVSVDVDDVEACSREIGDGLDGVWTDEETNVYLTEIDAAIRSGRVWSLQLPSLYECRSHPAFRKGTHPYHLVGLKCGYATPVDESRGELNQHERRRRRQRGVHDHSTSCEVWVPACDVETWIQDHQDQHHLLVQVYPRAWQSYQRTQRSCVDHNSRRIWVPLTS